MSTTKTRSAKWLSGLLAGLALALSAPAAFAAQPFPAQPRNIRFDRISVFDPDLVDNTPLKALNGPGLALHHHPA